MLAELSPERDLGLQHSGHHGIVECHQYCSVLLSDGPGMDPPRTGCGKEWEKAGNNSGNLCPNTDTGYSSLLGEF